MVLSCLLLRLGRRGLNSNTTKNPTRRQHTGEIGPDGEHDETEMAEMKRSCIEDHQTIDLDVKCHAKFDMSNSGSASCREKRAFLRLSDTVHVEPTRSSYRGEAPASHRQATKQHIQSSRKSQSRESEHLSRVGTDERRPKRPTKEQSDGDPYDTDIDFPPCRR